MLSEAASSILSVLPLAAAELRRRRRGDAGGDRHGRRSPGLHRPPGSRDGTPVRPRADPGADGRRRRARLGPARLGGPARRYRRRGAERRAARHVLGHLPPHRQRPRRGPARKSRSLPDPRGTVRGVRLRRARDRAAEGAAGPRRRADRPRLVRARGRLADVCLRRLLADRLPPRRRLAPAVRPGRHALGADAPDADRRRGAVAGRAGGAPRGGLARACTYRRTPRARPGASRCARST